MDENPYDPPQEPAPLPKRRFHTSWPRWVRVGVWPRRRRAAAMRSVWVGFVIGSLSVVITLVSPIIDQFLGFLFGIGILVGVALDWLAIHWIDTHDAWQ